MKILPVIERELRAEARNRLTYWLRVLVAGAAIITFTLISASPASNPATQGLLLFVALNQTLHYTIVFLVPLLTADCISRERREGTLGLLFLTPLRARDIILGKSLLHGLRGVTFMFSALPVLALPLLLGGVSLESLLRQSSYHLSTLLVALTAGIWASIRNVEWLQSVVAAECASIVITFALNSLVYIAHLHAGFGLPMVFVSAVAMLATIRWAARRLEETWQADCEPQSQPRWVRLFADSGFWRGVFRWNKGKTLDRNPIAWLQEYSWTARLTKWGWCALTLVSQISLFLGVGWSRDPTNFQVHFIMLLALGMAFSATGSFRREWQNGALELLLVTPLTTGQLIRGRIWGVWCHFFPAALILFFCWQWGPFQHGRLYQLWLQATLTALVTLPVIGLFFSMLRLNFLLSWSLCSLVGLWVLLWMRFSIPPFIISGRRWSRFAPFFQTLNWAQVAIACVALWLLYRNLHRRYFALEQTGT